MSLEYASHFKNQKHQCIIMHIINLIHRYDADILIGYEVQKSSWGYLVERAAALNINLTGQLNRIPGDYKLVTSNKSKVICTAVSDDRKAYAPRNNAEPSPAVEFARRHTTELNVIGRIILNIWRIIQHEVALTSYTFENAFYHILHQRTAKYSFQTLTRWYSKFEPLYW